MNINPHTLGQSLIITSSLLATFLLALRVCNFFTEKPDPKLTYATLKQFNHLNNHLLQYKYETDKKLTNLRLETKNDHQLFQDRCINENTSLSQITRKISQDVAALNSQSQIYGQLIKDLSLKTDKIIQLIKH